eukprot:Unigene2655_Nuclearia_a/m.8210 Unigene2655_Nuclearia_a/g.8210  ORF Unigene2655_Nuclearia_a/g.8210 Unigene2655_Nuclearia_a/m.8210 type:complete len:383 (-) Unigene2655_Nuclearia_a:1224-2372(-)
MLGLRGSAAPPSCGIATAPGIGGLLATAGGGVPGNPGGGVPGKIGGGGLAASAGEIPPIEPERDTSGGGMLRGSGTGCMAGGVLTAGGVDSGMSLAAMPSRDGERFMATGGGVATAGDMGGAAAAAGGAIGSGTPAVGMLDCRESGWGAPSVPAVKVDIERPCKSRDMDRACRSPSAPPASDGCTGVGMSGVVKLRTRLGSRRSSSSAKFLSKFSMIFSCSGRMLSTTIRSCRLMHRSTISTWSSISWRRWSTSALWCGLALIYSAVKNDWRYMPTPPLTGASTTPLSAIVNGLLLAVLLAEYLASNVTSSRFLLVIETIAFSIGDSSSTDVSITSLRRMRPGNLFSVTRTVFCVHRSMNSLPVFCFLYGRENEKRLTSLAS